MTLTIHLPADQLDPQFGISPALESALSIHVLSSPKQHALHLPWVRSCRGLSLGLRKELRSFRFFFQKGIGGFFSAWKETSSFEEDLDRVRKTSEAEVTAGFAALLVSPDTQMDDLEIVQREATATAGIEFPDVADLVQQIFVAPTRLLERFLDMIQSYWDEAFRREWERIEPCILSSRELCQNRLRERGEIGFFGAFADQLRFRGEGRVLELPRPFDRTVVLDTPSAITLNPSVYTWPHVMVAAEELHSVVMTYPVATLANEASMDSPPRELVALLRLLADEQRLKLLRLLAQQPRSTQELAALAFLSEPAVSRHLTKLASAGLVESRRHGYYVVYEVNSARMEPLSAALLGYVTGQPA